MRHEDIPDINNPKIKKAVLEGDKLIKEVLNGGSSFGRFTAANKSPRFRNLSAKSFF